MGSRQISKYFKAALLLMVLPHTSNAGCCYHYHTVHYVPHHGKGSSVHKGHSNTQGHHLKSEDNHNQGPTYNTNHQNDNYNHNKPNSEQYHYNGYYDETPYAPQHNQEDKHKNGFQQHDNSPNQFNVNKSFGSNKDSNTNGHYERPNNGYHEYDTTVYNDEAHKFKQPQSNLEYNSNNYNKQNPESTVVGQMHNSNNGYPNNPNIQREVNKANNNNNNNDNNNNNNNNNNNYQKHTFPSYDKTNNGNSHQQFSNSGHHNNNNQQYHEEIFGFKPIYHVTTNKKDVTNQMYGNVPENTPSRPIANDGGEQYHTQSGQGQTNNPTHNGRNQKFLSRSKQINKPISAYSFVKQEKIEKGKTIVSNQNYSIHPAVYVPLY